MTEQELVVDLPLESPAAAWRRVDATGRAQRKWATPSSYALEPCANSVRSHFGSKRRGFGRSPGHGAKLKAS